MNATMNSIPDTLVTTYVEMTSEANFRPAFLDPAAQADCQVIEMERADVDYYRFFYGAVGGPWNWTDRLRMSPAELQRELEHPGLTVDVLYVAGAPAGFIEMVREGADTEVVYFGLREAYFGRGLGKHFLSVGVQRAWDDGAERVWLHTCNLDEARAIQNYRKRGFEGFRVDEDPMPPWLGPGGEQVAHDPPGERGSAAQLASLASVSRQ